MQIRTYKQAEKLRKEIEVIETEMERIMDIEDRDNDDKFNELKLNAYGALNDTRNSKEREFEAIRQIDPLEDSVMRVHIICHDGVEYNRKVTKKEVAENTQKGYVKQTEFGLTFDFSNSSGV